MVSSQDGDAVPVPNFECDEQRNRLDAVVAAVHVVAHEQVVGFRRRAADFEEFDEIVELSVNVSADRDGTLDSRDILLLGQNFSGRVAHLAHLRL